MRKVPEGGEHGGGGSGVVKKQNTGNQSLNSSADLMWRKDVLRRLEGKQHGNQSRIRSSGHEGFIKM